MARKSKYVTPDLNLVPEAPEVLSRDFNLFYRPEEKPLPAGLKEFASALDRFSQRGAVQGALLAETKVKKSESAKALKDHIELKLKFRDAVKDGKIDKNANPYYLEKYKELTLNQFANEFSDHVLKKYKELNVGINITEGAFDSFYKDELKAYIKKNKLGFFKPEELEKSFFKETSAYRNQLEATHKANLLENFNKSFDEKLKNRIVGVITKFKNYDTGLLSADDTDADKFDKIAEALQKEIGDLIDTTGDGKATIDAIFDGLALYVQTTEDYEFALELINKIPEKLIGGTDKIANIGRIKNKKDELELLLIQSQNERLKNETNLDALQKESETIETTNFLEAELKKNPEFNITQWKNQDGLSETQIDAAEAFIKDQQYDGGASDNWEAIKSIEKLLDEEKYLEAHKLVSELFRNGDIRKSSKIAYHETIIPNARDLKGNPFFEIPIIKNMFDAWTSKINSGAFKDPTKAVLAEAYLKKHLRQWLKDNQNKDIYKNDTAKLENDFITEFDQHIVKLRQTGEFEMLFGTGVDVIDKDKSALETLEEKIAVKEKNYGQEFLDFKEMSDKDFEKTYNMSRKDWARLNGKEYKEQ